MRALSGLLLALGAALGGVACDESQAFHMPRPGLERMLEQSRRGPYSASSAFADGRAMRTPPPDTVVHERPEARNGDRRVTTGRDEAGYVSAVPLVVTRDLLETGRRRFEVVCAACHGIGGDGLSVVAEKMERRRPESLHTERVRALAPGQVFEIASRGYGYMPGYGAMLDPAERWAIVAYLDALRLSRSVAAARLPPDVRADLERLAP